MIPTDKPKRVWKGRNILIWTVLSAAVVFILVSFISDLEALKVALAGFPVKLLVPVGLLSLGNYLLRYVKWHWYLKILGHRIKRFPNLLVFLAGFALTVTPGKVGEFIKALPDTEALTIQLLRKGQERYNIFCSPCHGRVGDGKGIMVNRGYVPPPTFHSERLREIQDGYLYDVITNGIRNMPAYRYQVPVDDRWAIVSYLRALQRSQNASLEDIPEPLRENVK